MKKHTLVIAVLVAITGFVCNSRAQTIIDNLSYSSGTHSFTGCTIVSPSVSTNPVSFTGTSTVTYTSNNSTTLNPGFTGGGYASGGYFLGDIQPVSITSFSPGSGPVGTAVVITGTGFSGAAAVKFNGTAAGLFIVNSCTQITAVVPDAATTGTISVTASTGTIVTSGSSFTVTGTVCSTCSNGYTYSFKWGSSGTGNGNLSSPAGIAVDGSGNTYVADVGNNRVQKFNSSGTYVSQWGSSGSGNGQFSSPWGVALDASGNVYVTDGGNNRVQRFTTSDGVTYTYDSQWGTSGSGTGNFNTPKGIAIDGLGYIYVVDAGNNRVQKFSVSGVTYTFVDTWGSFGTSGSGHFNNPSGIAVDGSGKVYVSDGNNNVQKFSNSSGSYTNVGNLGGSGAQGLAVDGSGNIYIVENGDHYVKKYNSSGTFITKLGFSTSSGFSGVSGSVDGQFSGPSSIAVDGSCNFYVTDAGNNRVEVFAPSSGPTITNFYITVGSPSSSFAINGAGFTSVTGVDIYGSASGIFTVSNPNFITGLVFLAVQNYPGAGVSTSSCGSVSNAGYDNGHLRVARPGWGFDSQNSGAELTASVFPNPSSGDFVVSFPGASSFDLEVYNSLGESILKETATGESYKVSDQKLPAGIYHVKLTSDGETNHLKVVVNK